MTSRIVDKSPTKRIIQDKSSEKRRILPDTVAAAFGAETVGSKIPRRGSPLSAYAIRDELFRRLRSTGGRPALEGADLKAKVPLSTEQYQAIESIAGSVAEGGESHPSVGQVASVLIELALRDLERLGGVKTVATAYEAKKRAKEPA
jgi:hypothetical protein